jgi:hypothetical protein
LKRSVTQEEQAYQASIWFIISDKLTIPSQTGLSAVVRHLGWAEAMMENSINGKMIMMETVVTSLILNSGFAANKS